MPLALRYRTVDVFSDAPLRGNALCVVLDACPDDLQQRIAREMNLSETTFVTMTGEASYDVRIYTPFAELPFAGHPTVGTAWVLGPGRWSQRSAGATVTVTVDAAGATMTQPDPELRPIDPAAATVALGLPAAESAWVTSTGGTSHVLVLTDAPLDGLEPDQSAIRALAAAAGTTGVGVARRIDDANVHVRMWVAGLFEDPGTGSLAGPLAVLAHRTWGCDPVITVRQGDEIGRACRIRACGTIGAVTVGGPVALCAEGRLRL